ncbi:MAG: hypothetical protein WBD40_19840 [Tepidisphaeraceae bacterium]
MKIRESLFALLILASPVLAQKSNEMVLFPFDDHSIPFNKGVLLTMVPGEKSLPVMKVGPKGAPDDRRVYFSGTIIKVGDEYRMWYSGYDRAANRKICYAVSKDGLKWDKPELGLVEYNGGKANNLVAIDGGNAIDGALCLVLHDPEDPDPAKRFKMMREFDPHNKCKGAFSPDGLTWKSAGGDKFLVTGEPSGLVKHEGLYYMNAHSGAIRHPVAGAHKRTMQTFVSADFENWTTAAHMSFRRDNIPPRPPTDFEFNRGPQVHLGASLWNRGNVFLGFYGMYENPTNDRRDSRCDIGLIVSPDAIHFKEPLPDFKIVPGFEELDRAEPRLVQGQAFENIGEQTMFWYGIWTEVNRDSPTGVRVATWKRDRLGYFRPAPGIAEPHCISRPLAVKPGARVFINAGSLSDQSQMTVELLDEKFRPIPGYSGDDCIPITKNDFRAAATWKGKQAVDNVTGPVRVRINWIGEGNVGQLFAAYVE